MTDDIKYPVPRLLSKRARKRHKLRAMWPELARRAKETDAMGKFLSPAIADEMKQIADDDLDQLKEQDSQVRQQAQTLGFSQKLYRVSLRSKRIVNSGRMQSVFEAVSNSAKAGFPSKPNARHFTGVILEQMKDGWREAGFTDARFGVSAKTSDDGSERDIEITTDWITAAAAKKYEPAAYIYHHDRKSGTDIVRRPDLWEMYRALKIPQGFSKPFCSLPGQSQHRVLIGVVNVWSTPLPKGSIVVQCEFFDRRNKFTRERRVQHGYMVFHPEVPFYGFGGTAKKAIFDMKKSMAKRLTEIVRQSSS